MYEKAVELSGKDIRLYAVNKSIELGRNAVFFPAKLRVTRIIR